MRSVTAEDVGHVVAEEQLSPRPPPHDAAPLVGDDDGLVVHRLPDALRECLGFAKPLGSGGELGPAALRLLEQPGTLAREFGHFCQSRPRRARGLVHDDRDGRDHHGDEDDAHELPVAPGLQPGEVGPEESHDERADPEGHHAAAGERGDPDDREEDDDREHRRRATGSDAEEPDRENGQDRHDGHPVATHSVPGDQDGRDFQEREPYHGRPHRDRVGDLTGSEQPHRRKCEHDQQKGGQQEQPRMRAPAGTTARRARGRRRRHREGFS